MGVVVVVVVDVREQASCDSCDGTGSKDKSKPTTCKVCRGTGQVR